jgi:hypothetical protein
LQSWFINLFGTSYYVVHPRTLWGIGYVIVKKFACEPGRWSHHSNRKRTGSTTYTYSRHFNTVPVCLLNSSDIWMKAKLFHRTLTSRHRMSVYSQWFTTIEQWLTLLTSVLYGRRFEWYTYIMACCREQLPPTRFGASAVRVHSPLQTSSNAAFPSFLTPFHLRSLSALSGFLSIFGR